jgi:prophage regulatory protein
MQPNNDQSTAKPLYVHPTVGLASQSNHNHYLSDRQTAGRYSVSRPTIWRWVGEGRFPKPIKLSPGCSRWRVADLEKWEAEQAMEG